MTQSLVQPSVGPGAFLEEHSQEFEVRWQPSGLLNTCCSERWGGGVRGQGGVPSELSVQRGWGRGCLSHKGHRRDLPHSGPAGRVGKRGFPRAGGALPKGTLSTWPFSPPPTPARARQASRAPG